MATKLNSSRSLNTLTKSELVSLILALRANDEPKGKQQPKAVAKPRARKEDLATLLKQGVASRQYVFVYENGKLADLAKAKFVSYSEGVERKSLHSTKSNTTSFARWIGEANIGGTIVLRYSPKRDRWMAFEGVIGSSNKHEHVYDLATKGLVR